MSVQPPVPPGPADGDDALRMAIVDKVQRLEELQADEGAARRRTVRRAWLLVLVAGFVLSAIVAGFGIVISSKRAELTELEAQGNRALEKVDAAAKQVTALEVRLAELRQREQALNSALSQLPRAQLETAVGNAWASKTPPALWVPRAYLHILDAEDRAWASEVSRKLREQGVIVPGIEYVASARNLRRTDVRYYRKADRDAAQAIVDRLEAMGVPAVLNYLWQYENSDTVRPKNFEIWFIAGSREVPVR